MARSNERMTPQEEVDQLLGLSVEDYTEPTEKTDEPTPEDGLESVTGATREVVEDPDEKVTEDQDQKAPGEGDDEKVSADASTEKTADEGEPDHKPEDQSWEEREQGLKREIQRLRSKTQALQYRAPTPPPAQPTTAPVHQPTHPGVQIGGRIPVKLSADGTQFYIDPSDARQALAPSPEEQQRMHQAHEYNTMLDTFQRQDDTSARVSALARSADDYLSLKTVELLQDGYRFSNSADLAQVMRQAGVDKEVEKLYPELAPYFDEFVEAFGSTETAWKRQVLGRIARGLRPRSGTGDPGQTVRRAPPVPVRSTPRSMTRPGSSSSGRQTAIEAEFESLQSRLFADARSLSESEYKRLTELGRKLERDGY